MHAGFAVRRRGRSSRLGRIGQYFASRVLGSAGRMRADSAMKRDRQRGKRVFDGWPTEDPQAAVILPLM